MTEEATPDSAGRMSDKAESSDSPIHSDQGTSGARHEDCHLDKSPTSPGPRGEHHHHQRRMSRASDGFRSDDADHGQFYPVPSQSFVSVGQESQGDDLPLVFSFANHEDDSSKVYSCHICNFRTAFKNSLVNHQAVHSDARPWICEICDYAAKRKQDLKKHLQTMHGMIVDSLALRMGNNPQTCVSSSSLSSPVDTKPVIVNSAVSADDGGSSAVGVGGSHGMNSSAPTSQQQTVAGFRQPLASSAMLNPAPRSAPAAVKIKEDHFPFCPMPDEKISNRFIPSSSTDSGLSHLKQEFRKDLESKHSSTLDNFFLQRLHGHKDEQLIHSSSENASVKSCAHTESKEGRSLPPVSKMLPKRDRNNSSSITDECSSANTSVLDSFRCSDPLTSEGIIRSEALSSQVTVYSQSGAELIQRRKRASASSSDRLPIRVPRFQSPASDLEGCPQVTSQSDRGGNMEFISSTVTHSRAQETKKSFHCGHCDILFFESAMYLMHAGLHDSANPWKCSICGRTFFEKYSFTSHFINQH